MYTGHEDRFQYPLGVGIILVLLSLSFGERRHWRTGWKKNGFSLATLMLSLSITGCGTAEERAAERALHEGEHPYRAERFDDAATVYARGGSDPRVTHNLGNAEYRLALWDTAIVAFGNSMVASSSAQDQAYAAHNLGNAWSGLANEADSASIRIAERIRTIRIDGDDIGQKVRLIVERDSLRKLNVEQTHLVDSALTQATEAYKAALRRNPADEDTRHNLALALYRIAERVKEDAADGDKGKENERKELSEEAREIMAKADELVEQYKFKEALKVMQAGLKAHPTLQQEQAYVQKLDVVTKAAEAK
jgi:hypothetical protein